LDKNGGNRTFYLWLRKYNLLKANIKDKYSSLPIKFYGQRLEAISKGRDFNQKAPSSYNWREEERRMLQEEN